MPQLIDLPTELLARISHAVHPADIVSFVLSNRFVYAIGRSALEQKRYDTITFGYGESGNAWARCDDTKCALLLLNSIVERPHIAKHPYVMRFGNPDLPDLRRWHCLDGEDRESLKKDLVPWRNAAPKSPERVEALVKACNFIPDNRKEEMFHAVCDPENAAATIAFLLAMLPNLTTLFTNSISRMAEGQRILTLVQRIAKANLNPEHPVHGKALTSLREIVMEHTDTEYGVNMEDLVPFAMLPSMRILTGIMIAGESFTWPPSFRPASSYITSIDFENSAVDADAFEALLKGISALESFRYHHGGAIIGYAMYSCTGTVAALRKYAAHSLQSMDIEGFIDKADDEYDYVSAGSLKSFTALKSVRLEDSSFRRPEADDDLEAGPLADGKFY